MTKRFSLLLSLGLLILAPLVAGGLEIARASARSFPSADWALLQIGVHEAADGRLVLGPYSRFGWHHPGSLLFYALAPAYVLGKGATVSLHVAASVFSVLALLTAVGAWFRACRHSPARHLFVLLLAIHCVTFTLGWLGSVHSEVWNPIIALLPFTALLMTTVAVLVGSAALLPVAVVLHAFVSQSHAQYLLPATAALAVAAIGARQRWFSEKPDARPRAFHWAASVIVMLGCWLPAILDAALHQGGNAREIFRFFIAPDEASGSDPRRWLFAATRLSEPLPSILHLSKLPSSIRALASSMFGVLLVVAVPLLHFARSVPGEGNRDRLTGALLTVVESQLAASVVAIWILRGEPERHVLQWLIAVAFVCWLAIALVALHRFRFLECLTASASARWGMAAIVALATLFQVARAVAHPPPYGDERRAIRTIVPALECLSETAGSSPLIKLVDGDAWRLGAGVALQLLERSHPPWFEREESYRFGRAFRYVSEHEGPLNLPTVRIAAGASLHRARPLVTLPRGNVTADVLVDFGRSSARKYLAAGWSGDERAGERSIVRVTGTTARVRIGLFPRLAYKLRFSATSSAAGQTQRTDVVVNGHVVSRLDLSPNWSTYEVTVPASTVRPSTLVEFRFQDAASRSAAFDWLVAELQVPSACRGKSGLPAM